MSKGRLEAFSDGVLAIIITIMVLELKTPEGTSLSALLDQLPVLISYAISYTYIGIYWVNHHRLLSPVNTISSRVLWANLLWLFTSSLIPFATGWIAESQYSTGPTFFYSALLFVCAITYHILVMTVNRASGEQISFWGTIRRDSRSWVTFLCYGAAIVFSLFWPVVSYILFVAVAIYWILPGVSENSDSSSPE